MDDFAVQRVLLAADLVPEGRVASYGDIGRVAGVGPRQVGAIMRDHGDEVAWWRIVSASGELPAHLAERANSHWDAEGIAYTGDRVALRLHRVDATALAVRFDRVSRPE